MTREEYEAKFKEDDSPGWWAIDEVLDKIYGEQKPRHYAPSVPYMLGGEDPIDGISIYDCAEHCPHRHIISYGMSELHYNPENAGEEISGWGFEFTMRVAPFELDPHAQGTQSVNSHASEGKGEHEPFWATNLMQNLARYVYSSKKWFEAYHFIPANGPIRAETDTALTAIIFVPDPRLGRVNTPHGAVEFLQMFGITQAEYDWLLADPTTARVEQLANIISKDNPLFITDLKRTKSYV